MVWSACKPGCNSSMPSGSEQSMAGYSWWDLYNVSTFFHSLGHDVFILSMPLKGELEHVCAWTSTPTALSWLLCVLF